MVHWVFYFRLNQSASILTIDLILFSFLFILREMQMQKDFCSVIGTNVQIRVVIINALTTRVYLNHLPLQQPTV